MTLSDVNRVSLIMIALMFCVAGAHAQHGAGRTEAQQKAIDHMHHELHEDQEPWKEKEAQALKELNEMTIQEDVELDEVYAKIDELMEAKNHIMRLRYEHLIEMRKILTKEQRVEYDKRVLQRSEVR